MKLTLKFPLLCLCAAALLNAAPNDPFSQGEKAEDVRLSPSLKPVEDVPGLPRVLLIGDSISMGYTLMVREALKGKANVHRPPTNCGSTVTGIKQMKDWLGEGKWDVIHFNFGLHDLKYIKADKQNVPLATYEKNLQTLIDQMKATGATLIFATTTPVPEKTAKGYARIPADVGRYNAAAVAIMRKNGIAVDDLYTLILPKADTVRVPNDVHFHSEGSQIMAAQIAQEIEKALAQRAKAGKQ